MQAEVVKLALDLLVREPDIEGFFGGLTKTMVEESESYTCAVWLLVCSSPGMAQERPEPETGFRVPAIAFRDIRIVQQPGQVIEKGNLVLRDGRIEAVGAEAAIPVDARVIDGAGLTAYPGFIDAATSSLIDPEAMKPKDEELPPDFRQNVLGQEEVVREEALESRWVGEIGIDREQVVQQGRAAAPMADDEDRRRFERN